MASYDDSELNLKATELSLALPGHQQVSRPTTSRKRSLSDDESIAPTKVQAIGWPPVKSYRKNILQTTNGSGLFVKVNMDGALFLRKIDLKACKGYVELLKVVEEMFKVEIGQYSESEGFGQSDYKPSYEDKDGDWMLVGDVPWEMFVSSCRRLRIIKNE